MDDKCRDCPMMCKRVEPGDQTASYSSVLLSASAVLKIVEDDLRRFRIAGVVCVNDVARVSKTKVVAELQFSKTLTLPVSEMIVVARTTRSGNQTVLHIECDVPADSCEHPTIGTVLTLMGRSIFERLVLIEQERGRRSQRPSGKGLVTILLPILILYGGLTGVFAASDSKSQPKLAITRPKPGETFDDTPIVVKLAVEGFKLVPPEPYFGKAGPEDTGHVHVRLDSYPLIATSAPQLMIGKHVGERYLPKGKHVLTVELVLDNHDPLTPAVRRSVVFYTTH
jgi:hypothetical protein